MPLREFKCKKCGNFFDFLILSKNDEDELQCPACNSQDLEQLFSVFGVAGAVEKPLSTGSSGCSACGGGTCSTCGH
ncbi:zinc ribbon domain-containing protein [bacterium]|nr:zinc ribbon domain-containing protein [bacterium]